MNWSFLVFFWVPAHISLVGNKQADKAANNGTSQHLDLTTTIRL